jgi:farnesyl diphosphate synthase
MSGSVSRPAAKTETSPDTSFAGRLNAAAAETEQLLDRLLGATPIEGEIARPHRVVEAMRYTSLGGGKRLRPFLTIETAALFGVPRSQALMAGAAIELVHCYSLVHDDLPAMDDDDLRRGRPTCHRQFDEATAILAGDALLTLAFEILAAPETHPAPSVRCALIADLARAAGGKGMVGGQTLDMAAERNRFDIGEITGRQNVIDQKLLEISDHTKFIRRVALTLKFHEETDPVGHVDGCAFFIPVIARTRQ